jgi:hypothetical protein
MSQIITGVKMPRHEYDAIKAVRATELKLAAKSLFHFRARQKGNAAASASQKRGWDLGSLSHSINLENDLSKIKVFDVRKKDGTEYASPRASTAFKEMVEENPDLVVITKDDFEALLDKKNAFWSNDDVCAKLDGAQVEVAFCAQDPITGLWLKCQADFAHLQKKRFGDYKNVPDASEFGVGRFAAKAKWPIQVGHYAYVIELATGIKMEGFDFIAQEFKAPFYTDIHALSEFDFENCAQNYRDLLNRLAVAMKDNEWPGYKKRGALTFPPWAYEFEELEEEGSEWGAA